jgi:hypothetical protein
MTNIMPTHVKISIEPGIRELFLKFYPSFISPSSTSMSSVSSYKKNIINKRWRLGLSRKTTLGNLFQSTVKVLIFASFEEDVRQRKIIPSKKL